VKGQNEVKKNLIEITTYYNIPNVQASSAMNYWHKHEH
jgi:hypothetical protein